VVNAVYALHMLIVLILCLVVWLLVSDQSDGPGC
jgi:hypothetical protein